MAEAGQVVLVWGINGWQVVPEEQRPAGTVVKNDLMRTPMAPQGDTFVAKVQAPAGAIIHYGFFVPKTRTGAAINAWEGTDAFHLVAAADNPSVTVKSTVTLDQGGKSRYGMDTQIYVLMAIVAAFNVCIIALRNRFSVLASATTVLLVLVGLTVEGLALRLFAASAASHLLTTPSQFFGDEAGYHYLATALLDGHFFEWPARTPVYPLFLAACYWTFGQSFPAVLYVQAFVSASVIPLTFILARRFTTANWALLAAGLAALHPALINHVTRLYTEALYTPLQLLTLLSLVWALEKPIYRRFAVAGALLAVTTLTRPTLVLFALVVPFLLPNTLNLRRKTVSWIVYTGVIIMMIAPWSYHNYQTYHIFLPLSVTAGVVLWHGSPEYYHLTFEKERSALQVWDEELNPARNGGHDPMSIEGDRYFLKRAIASILREPGVYLWYALQKLVFFWIGSPAIDWPSYALFGFDAMRPYYSRPHIIGVFLSRLLPFVALIGLFILRGRLKEFLPLLAFCGYFMVFHALTQSEVRYSEPLHPILATIIAAAASRAWGLYEEYRQRMIVPVHQEV
jgi:4-amino-4-deoxy-L-arabinose transferase-like glycosyltransferase